MKETLLHTKGKRQLLMLLIMFFFVNVPMLKVGVASPILSISVLTDRQFYYLRHSVTVYGNLTSDGQPVTDGLVALQVDDPYDSPVLYRTLSTGLIQTEDWKVKIVDVIPCDENYDPKNSFKPGNWLNVNVTGRNDDVYAHSVTIAISIYDGNQNPIGLTSSKKTILAGRTFNSYAKIQIPDWAYIGNATVYANLYTDYPKARGTPYCPEASANFQIVNVMQFSSNSAGQETQQTNGSYSTTFRISPEPRTGQYTVYVSSQKEGWPTFKFTSFEVKSASYPPDASFYYTPPKPYVNMTVTFDASASTANGGEIVSYEWDFGDGYYASGEIVTHTYTSPGTYTVNLTVIDSEGLWDTDLKPVKIWPPEGPTARFGWTPSAPYVNDTITFDARASSPGWNGTDWADIVSYTWDFDDGNITTVSVPTINHVYSTVGNYTVSLNITDTQGLWSFISHVVEVKEAPGLGPWDVNGDGMVDITDIVIVAIAFGSTPGDPNWNPAADINEPYGLIDIGDIVLVALHFGESI